MFCLIKFDEFLIGYLVKVDVLVDMFIKVFKYY